MKIPGYDLCHTSLFKLASGELRVKDIKRFIAGIIT